MPFGIWTEIYHLFFFISGIIPQGSLFHLEKGLVEDCLCLKIILMEVNTQLQVGDAYIERHREYYIYNFLMEEKPYIKQCNGKPVRLKVTGMSNQALSIATECSVAIIKREKLLYCYNTPVLSSGCFRPRCL